MLVKLESDIYVISFTVSSWEIEPSISRKYDMTICLNQTLFYRSNQIFFYRRHFINYCAILITDTNPYCWQFYRWVYWTIYISTVCGGRDCIAIVRLFSTHSNACIAMCRHLFAVAWNGLIFCGKYWYFSALFWYERDAVFIHKLHVYQ